MPRWMKLARGMIGTGVVFSAGIGTAAAAIGVVMSVVSDFSVVNAIVPAARFAVLGFPIGVVFSALLALVARGRAMHTLSVKQFAAMGAGVGLLAFLLLSINGAEGWSAIDTALTLLVLPGVGAAIAAASLVIARRSGEALATDDDSPNFGSVDDDVPALRAGDRLRDVADAGTRERVRDGPG